MARKLSNLPLNQGAIFPI